MTASLSETENIATERLFRPWLDATGLVLAVSGGPDSTALMHLAAAWRRGSRPPLFVACVDHGLRSGSAFEAEAVCWRAGQLGLSASVLVWEESKPVRAVQEQARTARYRLLVAHATMLGASHLVTAHTLDDQAETLLFRMARGSGPAGLAGMAPSTMRDGIGHLRPFLGLRKSALLARCRHEGWAFENDPSNADGRFARARWRRLTPLLECEGLSAERLGDLARRAARAEDALRAYALMAGQDTVSDTEAGQRIEMHRLATYPDEIVLRVLRRVLVDVSGRANIRLDGLERLRDDLLTSRRAGRSLRRTLHHCLVSLDRPGELLVTPEPPRRAGRPDTSIHLVKPSSPRTVLPAAVPLAITVTHHTLRK